MIAQMDSRGSPLCSSRKQSEFKSPKHNNTRLELQHSSLNERLDHFFTVKKSSTKKLEPLNVQPSISKLKEFREDEARQRNTQNDENDQPFKASTFG